jgi:hypothetical protein
VEAQRDEAIADVRLLQSKAANLAASSAAYGQEQYQAFEQPCLDHDRLERPQARLFDVANQPGDARAYADRPQPRMAKTEVSSSTIAHRRAQDCDVRPRTQLGGIETRGRHGEGDAASETPVKPSSTNQVSADSIVAAFDRNEAADSALDQLIGFHSRKTAARRRRLFWVLVPAVVGIVTLLAVGIWYIGPSLFDDPTLLDGAMDG